MNIGFVSTRLAGTDGVSLETAKLAVVLRQMGHQVFYCAGELEGDVAGLCDPALHFIDATAVDFHDRAFSKGGLDSGLLAEIKERAQELLPSLRQFVNEYAIDYLIIQNAFAIPMQLPLAQALTWLLQESGLPALAHNHDFYWERARFDTHCLGDFLDEYFPPSLPNLQHAVINSLAQTDLAERRGLDSLLIPNVFDFETPAPGIDDYNRDFRQAIGLTDSDWLILQPTRVIPRKGIELAIDCLAQLADPRAKLVITHHAGDEGLAYLHQLQAQAKSQGVDLRYVADIVAEQRGQTLDGRKVYTLWDTYPHADFVMYPSLIEGFGNALIETIYFHLPALVNRYPVYANDIGPLGFNFVEIEASITGTTVQAVREILQNAQGTKAIVAQNYDLGLEHFSYQTLRQLLSPIFS